MLLRLWFSTYKFDPKSLFYWGQFLSLYRKLIRLSKLSKTSPKTKAFYRYSEKLRLIIVITENIKFCYLQILLFKKCQSQLNKKAASLFQIYMNILIIMSTTLIRCMKSITNNTNQKINDV